MKLVLDVWIIHPSVALSTTTRLPILTLFTSVSADNTAKPASSEFLDNTLPIIASVPPFIVTPMLLVVPKLSTLPTV